MTTVVPHSAGVADLLAPVVSTLRSAFGTDDLPGLVPGLLIRNEHGWIPTTALLDGSRLPELLDSAGRRWQASPHAAATLAWKAYSYWLALPAVLGWASARRVPLLQPADVLIRFVDQRPLLTFGLRRSVAVAVLAADPLAHAHGSGHVRVVDDDTALLAALRESLFDGHLTPMVDAIQQRARIGTRPLYGSVSSGIAHGILNAADVLPGSCVEDIRTLLATLGIEGLIELVPGPAREPRVQRRTCCLAFTLPRPKICAGCCIRAD